MRYSRRAHRNPFDRDASSLEWARHKAKIAKHRKQAEEARSHARYDLDAYATAQHHDAEADRLEAELEAVGRSYHRTNPASFGEADDWVEIEDADDWVTIEECACSSCWPSRANPRTKAKGAYADLDSILPVIDDAFQKHGVRFALDDTQFDVGPKNIEVKFTRGGKSRAGACAYSPSRNQCKITFNGLAWPAFTEEQRLNTVLHEAAHAIQFLTTGRSDHGSVWQRIAKSIGCTGDRCMSLEASQAMADAYAEAKGLPKRRVVTPEAAMEASADFKVGDYVSFEHKRETWSGKIVGKDVAHARVAVQQPRAGITGKIPYPLLQKIPPPRFAEKVAGVDKPAPGESLSAWQARTERARANPIPRDGSALFSGSDVFDFVEPSDPTEVSETRQVLRELKRGDVVTVGRSKWVVLRSLGDLQALVYKHPSKHQKLYELRLAEEDDDAVVIFQVGGSGQRISEDLVEAPLRATGETAAL